MSGKKQQLQRFLVVLKKVLKKSLKTSMLPILHCDVATNMYADHAQDHTWGYAVQVAGIVTTG
jgi:hypothetical protein